MKIFISVDMEGISGLVRWMDVAARGIDFERNRRLMTLDANAAIDGAFEAGATEGTPDFILMIIFPRPSPSGSRV